MRDYRQLDSAVSGLMRSVAGAVILPRFRNLASGEIAEKSPGEIVTVADREAEERLAAGLAVLDGGVRIVGEEACAADPALLRDLGRGAVWLVDPLDGTANFAAGRQPFGMIIALAVDGVVEAGWLYDPVADRMCHAVRGGGAFIGGRPLRTWPARRRRPIAALATQFMTPDLRDDFHRRADGMFDRVPIPRCAAEHYPRLCLMQNDVAMFQRTLPWDHAAGALLLMEAGGRVARWDGGDYRIDDGKAGLLATASPALWEDARAALFDEAELEAVPALAVA